MLSIRFPRSSTGVIDGQPYYENISKTKHGRITYSRYGIKLPQDSILGFKAETGFYRLFKRLGLATEIQTGDTSFDHKIYVICDHPHVQEIVQSRPELRAIVSSLFADGANHIYQDGAYLWVGGNGAFVNPSALITKLIRLKFILEKADFRLVSKWGDPFFWKALIASSIAYSVAGYGFVSFLEMNFVKETVHLNPQDILWMGLKVGALTVLFGLVAFFFIFRGSSRITPLIETSVVLILAAPFMGIQGISDFNRGLDENKATIVQSTVTQKRQVQHRGRKGRVYYTYHLGLQTKVVPEHLRNQFPFEIDVTSSFFSSVAEGSAIESEVYPGRLGFPWINSLKVAPRVASDY